MSLEEQSPSRTKYANNESKSCQCTWITDAASGGEQSYLERNGSETPDRTRISTEPFPPCSVHIQPQRLMSLFSTVSTHNSNVKATVASLDSQLTRRQIEIVCAIATGATNFQISRILDIKEATINEHIRNIKDRLNIEDRVTIGIIGHHWFARQLTSNMGKRHESS